MWWLFPVAEFAAATAAGRPEAWTGCHASAALVPGVNPKAPPALHRLAGTSFRDQRSLTDTGAAAIVRRFRGPAPPGAPEATMDVNEAAALHRGKRAVLGLSGRPGLELQ